MIKIVEYGTAQELIDSLIPMKGTSACSMELTTAVKHNKKHRETGELFNDVFKGEILRSYKEYGNFNISYENAVNNQRKREGIDEKFTSNSLPWGEWVENGENKAIIHKGEYYLRYYTGMNANSDCDKQVIYHYEDGTELTDEEIELLEGFLPSSKPNSKTQGIEKEVEPKVVKINGINKLNVGGFTFKRK